VELLYRLNELPPWPRVLVYGLQWAVIFLPTITILSAISSEFLNLHGQEKVLFFQRLLAVTGGVMILQTLWGHRYPLLDGPASALLLSFIVLAPRGVQTIQGGMIAGGAFLLVLSLSGVLQRLEPLFTDNVVGVILILIAVTILPYLAPMMIGAQGRVAEGKAGDPLTFAVSVAVIVSIALFSHWLRGFPKTIALFLGVILGTAVMWFLGRMEVGGIRTASWVSLPSPLVPGLPQFSLTGTLTFLVAYIAVMINGVGSMYSIGEVVGKDGLSARVERGIAATGLGGIAAGLLGIIGTVSYAHSPGIVLITRVGSRFAVTVCGSLLVSLVFLQKILAVLAAVPASVVGAAMITGMSAQVGAGISVLSRSGRTLDGRDYLVVGVPILLGAVVSILPQAFFLMFPFTVRALLQNGLVVGIVAVLLLEHLLLRRQGTLGQRPQT
jgi:xanthine/uracil permease